MKRAARCCASTKRGCTATRTWKTCTSCRRAVYLKSKSSGVERKGFTTGPFVPQSGYMRLVPLFLLSAFAAFAQLTNGVATSVTRTATLTADQGGFLIVARAALGGPMRI